MQHLFAKAVLLPEDKKLFANLLHHLYVDSARNQLVSDDLKESTVLYLIPI